MSILGTLVGTVVGGVPGLVVSSLSGSSASATATQDKELAGLSQAVIAPAVQAGLAAAAKYTDPLQQAKAFRAAISSISPGVHFGAADALTRQYYPAEPTNVVNPHKDGGLAAAVTSLLPEPLQTAAARVTGGVETQSGNTKAFFGFDTNPQTEMYVVGGIVLVLVLLLLMRKS